MILRIKSGIYFMMDDAKLPLRIRTDYWTQDGRQMVDIYDADAILIKERIEYDNAKELVEAFTNRVENLKELKRIGT